jgi:acetyl/propionyl-CoA carboxylase alpha subunit
MNEITKILIANRGEIAVRIIRTARAMGIATVAVYSDADRKAAHVTAADEAVRIGADDTDSSASTASYLNIGALLDAAARSGADSVHPGYGFLSERAEFARACLEAGLIFIGPPPQAIEAMGRKDYARRIAEQAGVPVLPTYQPDDPSMRFPVLVKAAAGGGGKGMRIVRDAAELPDALAAARREAESAFGDGTLLVERYVEHGRHVEVQVFADTHGNVLHLGERDCSVQRRHQKVVEESPAPTISTGSRERLLDAAVRLTKQVGYVNAGTVEFLVADEEFYLLEMNTRLQVEHPVTELVTGLDLVELQIRVAAGEQLPLHQQHVSARGHAIEVRVYAEDAEHGFLPQAGRAGVVMWPRGECVRVDAALRSFDEVSAWYDPMIGKVVGYGTDRESARQAVLAAVTQTRIDGLVTNLGFLSALLASAQFADAAIDTAWLDRNPDLPLHPRLGSDGPTPFDLRDGWRLAGPPRPAASRDERSRAATAAAATPLDGIVRAPMPGTVIALKVSAGQHVTTGEALGALEAMKMEHTLTAPHDGVVAQVGARVGEQVPIGAQLFVIENPADAAERA